MRATVLVTGATDGIGRLAASALAAEGHDVILHGRDSAKLADAQREVRAAGGRVETATADLSRPAEVAALAAGIAARDAGLDVLINNAGVFRAPEVVTPDGLDVRFAVNAIAPYLLTTRLLGALGDRGRVVNVSSAAQSPVDVDALAGGRRLSDFEAYSQSKLALTMWSRHLALALGGDGPVVVAVNPGSMLGTKMVREGFGVAGRDIGVGADILARAALSDEFAAASGAYFDNDSGRFASPHPDVLDPRKTQAVVERIEATLTSS